MTKSKKHLDLEKIINYDFKDKQLLKRALTRPSYANEKNIAKEKHQEALCTLGDAIVKVVVMELAINYGETKKKYMDLVKKIYENKYILAVLFNTLELWKFIDWGKGEKKDNIWEGTNGIRTSAECFEALMGAIYLDGKMKNAYQVFWHVFSLSEKKYLGKK